MKRKSNITISVISLLISLLVLTSCSGMAGKPTSTPQPEVETAFTPIVSATGKVVPVQYAQLSMQDAGLINEVLVKEDDLVRTGQPLLRLKGKEAQQGSIAAAKFELAAANKALDDLYKNPELRVAETSKAIVEARKAMRDAERRIGNLEDIPDDIDIETARANLAIAKDKLDKATKDYRQYEKKPEESLVRAAFLSKKSQAQKQYEAAQRTLNNLLGKAPELDMSEALANLELAQAQLAVGERDLEIYKQGPEPSELELAQERIANATAQLSAAQAALEDLEMAAPFDGMVTELYIHPHEWISPGEPALLLADLGTLQVETTDLNEIDVARVKIGDSASITFDALPDLVVQGTVVRIGSKAAEGAGVNYPVVVELEEIPEALRWGMTAFVDIQVE